MSRPLLPPRGIFISTRVLFGAGLKPRIRDTLLQLMALAWSSPGCRSTPLLSYPLLAELTGKSIKTLYGHVAALRDDHAALRLQRAGGGMFTITFADELFYQPDRLRRSAIPETHDDEEESLSSKTKDVKEKDSHHLHDDHAPRKKYARRKASRKGTEYASDGQAGEPARRLSPEFEQQMKEACIFRSLFEEIAASPYSEEELRALLAWTKHEHPESTAPLFVGRVRAGATAPPQYYLPPCPLCGGYGERHAANCRMRYISGSLKDVVEH